jgi:perosamine synthetase
MPSHISAMPSISPFQWLNTRTYPLPEPFQSPNLSMWYNARAAIWQALNVIQVKPGDSAALPAFCCGSEIEVFVQAGLRLNFFSVDKFFNPELESFAVACKGTKVALVTHYFGFPAELSEIVTICRENGTLLIEDCAHALYATDDNKSVGLCGDFAVFSMWKMVSLADGGALLINRTDLGLVKTAQEPPTSLVRKKQLHLISQGLYTSSNPLIRSIEEFRRWLKQKPITNSLEKTREQNKLIQFEPGLANKAISRVAYKEFLHTNHCNLLATRRKNYLSLEQSVNNFMPQNKAFSELRAGACPLFLPLIVPADKEFRRIFSEANIAVKHIWPWFHPQVPWNEFPFERNLKEKIIGLPVHHQLTTSDISRIQSTLSLFGAP